MHLAEVSSSDNLHSGHPSTLLTSVPVQNEKCGSGRTETYHVLQYKGLSSGPVSQLTISLRDTKGKRLRYHSSTSTRPYTYEMVDAGGPRSIRKCPWAALADLGDVKGFNRSGEEDQLYKRKMFTPSEGIRSLKFEELSDVDISHAVMRRLHRLAFTGDKWVAFADPVQQTGWFIDLKIASPYVVIGKEHKRRKVVKSGTRLCSFIPETRNIIVLKAPDQSYVLKTGNGKRGSFQMVSEFPPAGFICLGLSVSTILLEIVLGDGPDDFVDVLPCFKLKWPQKIRKPRGLLPVLQCMSGLSIMSSTS